MYEKALGSGSHVALLVTGQEALLGLCFLLTEGLPFENSELLLHTSLVTVSH